MEKIKHDLRLSETITPFGVGAIVDVRGESLIAPDTSWWDRKHWPRISCDRLLSRLGPGELRQPPTHAGRAAKETEGLLYWRFPSWRFCERCSKLSMLTGKYKGRWTNTCNCGGGLVPMRYIAVCTKGSHVQDIPWFMWAHRGRDVGVTEEVRFCRAYKELTFVRSAKHGEGLASLRINCGGCKRSRPLSELVGKDTLHRDGIQCGGRQPWEDEEAAKDVCDHHLVAVQRGATGNYIADRVSALDIPEEMPQSEELASSIRSHVYFQKVVADNGGPQAEIVAGWIAEELGVAPDAVLALAAGDGMSVEESIAGLRDGEWAAFVKKMSSGRDCTGGDFVVDGWKVSDETPGPKTLTDAIAGIGQVRRVREVRALRGFRRHSPDSALIHVDLGPDQKRQPVYPAIELYGEGIFLQFDEEAVATWERLDRVQGRAAILGTRRQEAPWAQRLEVPTPRFVALHTLAHLLIRRLAFASGYSSAALQEKIYANADGPDPMAGILIYTAAGDAQGTLGGLVRLGEPKRIFPLLTSALDDADVCSNDPVCIESDRQRSAHLNLSACHGCTLISETSCESGNRLLDRQLVLGGSKVPGFLEAVLPEVRQSLITHVGGFRVVD